MHESVVADILITRVGTTVASAALHIALGYQVPKCKKEESKVKKNKKQTLLVQE